MIRIVGILLTGGVLFSGQNHVESECWDLESVLVVWSRSRLAVREF